MVRTNPVRCILLTVILLVSIVAAHSVYAQQTVADPTLLPVATTNQAPRTTAYDALNVPALSAGSSYSDPTTRVTIYKLTSATYPTSTPTSNCHASPWWGHDYVEGGNEVSLPYNGDTRTILVRQDPDCGGPYWLVDFTPGVGVSNARQLTAALTPWIDLAFTFSDNPATPYYAYVSTVGANESCIIRRIDIRTNPPAEAPGSGWPLTDAATAPDCAVWLQQSENDSFFMWMRGAANGSTVVGYQPSTGTVKTPPEDQYYQYLNEPRIDRAGRYVALTVCPANPCEACGFEIWDWQTNSIAWEQPCGYDSSNPNIIPWGHVASLKDRWMYVDSNMAFPYEYTSITPDVPNSQTHLGGPTNSDCVDASGNWIQSPDNLDDQWALFSNCGGLEPSQGSGWLAPGGMVFTTVEADSTRYLLGFPYNTSVTYSYLSFAKLSPDGKYVLFTSDMDGSGRSDLFLAQVPTQIVNLPAPIAYWKLDEGSGTTTTDSSGNGHTGTLVNSPQWTAGISGDALAFNGTNNYVTVANSGGLNQYPLTVSAWFKTTSTSGVHGLINKYVAGSLNGYQIFLNNGNLCAWYFKDSADYVWDGSTCTLSTSGYADGNWHMVTFVVGPSGGALYADGVEKANLGWTGTAGSTSTSTPLTFASYPGVTEPYLAATIDDVRIYNTALDPSQVATLYDSMPPPVTWTDVSPNLTVNGSSLKKTSGCDGCEDATAVSEQQINQGADGYLQFTASETNALRYIGLTNVNEGIGAANMNFAIDLQEGEATVYENGTYRTNVPFSSGDVFSIAVSDGIVGYYKNGNLFYTSSDAPNYPLMSSASIFNINGTITDAVMKTQ